MQMEVTNKDKKIWSVYGGHGFVLGEFCKQFKDEVIRLPKEQLEPETPNIIYGISTTDNYNVYDDSTLDIETNLIHLMEVLDACQTKFKNKFEFVFISSWFVYGNTPCSGQFPLVEEAYCNPKGFYSITKRAAEQLLISYCETFGIKYKILRLANVLGSQDHKVSKKKNALQYLLRAIIQNENVELYDNGKFYRDYIDVKDCATAIKYCAESELPHKIYNISNGKSYLFRDLIEFAISYTKSKSNIWDKTDKPEFHSIVQSKDVFLDNEKLKETGYTQRFTIWETIQNIIDDYAG